jgi:hypothetical protein
MFAMISVFTPTLYVIAGLVVLALIVSIVNCTSIHGIKVRMITRNQQDAFGKDLLLAIDRRLNEAANVNRATIESLRDDYRAHVVEVAEIKASHAATVRQVDQVMASYARLHQLLVEQLLKIATGKPEPIAAPIA